jgi:predicted permease
MMAPVLEAASDDSQLIDRGRRMLTIKGRLKAGVTRDAASAEAAAIFAGFAARYPQFYQSVTATVLTELQSRVDGNPYQPLMVGLLGVLTLVLLAIACGNVANLVLGRASARTREIGVRLAMGADRKRLVRQLMTESLVLAVAGGIAGALIAGGAVTLLDTFAPSSGLDVPTPLAIRMDVRSVALTFLIAAGSAVLFGLAPALRAGRTDLLTALRPGAAEGNRERVFGRSALVVVQIAGSLMLLVAATQLAKGFSYALLQDPGFSTDHRVTMRLDPSLAGYSPDQTERFYRALTDRAAQVPGVRGVGLTSSLPMVPGYIGVAVAPEGFDFGPGQNSVTIVSSSVDRGYFDALGVGIVRGRGFLPTDTADSPPVVVVDRTFADRYLGSDPIVDRPLRHRVVSGEPPHSRDRHSNGRGRHARAGTRHDPEACRRAGHHWRRDRDGPQLCRWPWLDVRYWCPAVRSVALQPCPDRPLHNDTIGGPGASAACVVNRSAGSVAIRLRTLLSSPSGANTSAAGAAGSHAPAATLDDRVVGRHGEQVHRRLDPVDVRQAILDDASPRIGVA